MKSKLKIVLPVLLLVVGGVYKFVLSKPAAEPKVKVHGLVYVLPKDFLLNLRGGKFAKVSVGMVLEEHALAAEGGEGEAAAAPPEGFGPLPQEALVRAIVTDTLTGRSRDDLESSRGREEVKKRLKKAILDTTDVPVEEVLLPDVAIQ